MKKLLALILTSASLLLAVPEASTTVANANAATPPQISVQIGQRRDRDRDWRYRNRDWRYRNGYGQTVTQTRYVRRGWNTYRETYLIRYLPNGMVQTNLISRVRVS
jgi:hypothetical protein